MDPCAELTLRLVRNGQEALKPLSSLSNWLLLPDHRELTWDQAGELLTAARKPVIVAALLEPGAIAFWSLDSLRQESVRAMDREFANQRQYFSDKLEALGLTGDDRVETPDGEFQLSVADFRRWGTEYTVTVGIGLSKSPRARTARVLLRPPGGGGPPVGWVDPAAS
jgi:hypothetical protein